MKGSSFFHDVRRTNKFLIGVINKIDANFILFRISIKRQLQCKQRKEYQKRSFCYGTDERSKESHLGLPVFLILHFAGLALHCFSSESERPILF